MCVELAEMLGEMGFAQTQADDVKVVVAAEIADRWVQVAEIPLH
jgi:hypothetical protein